MFQQDCYKEEWCLLLLQWWQHEVEVQIEIICDPRQAKHQLREQIVEWCWLVVISGNFVQQYICWLSLNPGQQIYEDFVELGASFSDLWGFGFVVIKDFWVEVTKCLAVLTDLVVLSKL